PDLHASVRKPGRKRLGEEELTVRPLSTSYAVHSAFPVTRTGSPPESGEESQNRCHTRLAVRVFPVPGGPTRTRFFPIIRWAAHSSSAMTSAEPDWPPCS